MPKRSAGARPPIKKDNQSNGTQQNTTQPSPLSPSLRCLQILEAREAYIGFSRSSLQRQYTIINKANSRGVLSLEGDSIYYLELNYRGFLGGAVLQGDAFGAEGTVSSAPILCGYPEV
ncbi:hypothetical protein C4D60_Mb08t28930 [Musa balbisiana]|uniref:Uncharacterized protein n=1 Tax=Musa balbisiana TaxID=52838 RepID=A0A4S8K788_MUSBA|nr:hypothetical protein C4D60_Mb08t28930 [Musa balbisiana]